MRKFIGFLFFVAGVALAASLGIYLYYLPFPKDVEKIVYREVVRSIDFSDPDSLSEWEEKSFSDSKTIYSRDTFDGRTLLRGLSKNSSSAFYIRERLFHEDRPYVKWDWKVIRFPEREKKESLDSKEEFDFAAHFYVLFYSRFIINTRAIQYIWAEQLPEGATAVNPYTRNVRVKVLRTGNPGEWATEERDIAADYYELFGRELDRDVSAIAFMVNSSNTESVAEAYLTNIELGYLPALLEMSHQDRGE